MIFVQAWADAPIIDAMLGVFPALGAPGGRRERRFRKMLSHPPSLLNRATADQSAEAVFWRRRIMPFVPALSFPGRTDSRRPLWSENLVRPGRLVRGTRSVLRPCGLDGQSR